jgi:tetratricopeptide (TPR) repeat protein
LVEQAKHETTDTSITLASESQPKIAALAADDAGLFAVARDVYDYFLQAEMAQTPRHPISYTAPLLYRLSRQIDPVRQAIRAQKLVEAALGQGSLREANRYIDEARKGGATSVQDHFLQLAFYIACLNYEQAADILNELGDSAVGRYRILRLLRAVTLNRVRSHERALLEIDALIAAPETSCHELSVLASYKTAGLLHECRWKDAAQFVDQIRTSISRAKGYGYFLRNAAAAFLWGECKSRERAGNLLIEARNAMRNLHDTFGECTVLNNEGVLASYYRDFDQGLKLFEKAYSGLRVYGTHHLDEVGVNVGLGLLRLGRIEEARAHLIRYCSMTEWDLPRSFGENALALAEWLLDDRDSAIARIDMSIRQSVRVKLIEAQQRTLFNAALVEAAKNGPNTQFRQLVQNLRKANWTSEDKIALLEANANAGTIPKEKLCELWSLAGC